MSIPEKVRQALKELPDQPGCYMMRDGQGKIIYVGKAVSLRKRVQSYFREASLRSGSPKTRSLVNSVAGLEWIVLRNEAEALLTEGRLIKEYKPYYNVSFKDDKRFLLLRIDPAEPVPMFKFCRIRRDDGAVYFGPYVSSPAARATVDFVERKFGLRRCAPRVPDADTYKHCMNDIIRFCSAPCVGKVTREQYLERVQEACAFLRGQRPQYLKEVRAKMEEASQAMDFEKAAVLRDTLFMLHNTVKQNARVASTPEMRAADAVTGIGELQTALGLTKMPEVIEGYDISNISGTFAVASMVCAVDGLPAKNRYRRFRIRTVEGSDDPAMIAEVIKRRFTALLEEKAAMPDLLMIDGGITQMKAAKGELAALGVTSVPVVALAKRFEEIYVDETKPPLLLSRDSKALKVLQTLRDEAHRFALDYHHRLRNKRIRESVLDDVSGIGDAKKKALLQHFGSVLRLSKATVEEVAAVSGIGEKLAQEILATVRREHGTGG